MATKVTPTIDELWQRLQEQASKIEEQREEIRGYQARFDELEARLNGPDERARKGSGRGKSRLSRAKLLKGGALGVVGLAGAELVGSLGATSVEAAASYAAGTFYAEGESGAAIGFKTGTYTTDFTTYEYGVHAYGTAAAVIGHGSGDLATGVEGWSTNGNGVFGHSDSSVGVYGDSSGSGGWGVYGNSPDGTGVFGESAYTVGVGAISLSGVGILGQITGSQPPPSGTNVAIYGTGSGTTPGSNSPLGKIGVQGVSDTNSGVRGASSSGYGVYGSSNSSKGVIGVSSTQPGVEGISTSSYGCYGFSTSSIGVLGSSTNSYGIQATSTNYAGVRAAGATDGIYATGTSGRGAQLNGGAAQLRLIPSGAASHPSSGQSGDFFIDSANSLFFCKGGSSWIQLA
jgi:hypothetical protein